VAFANPTDQTANINFHFTDGQGNDIGSGSTTLGANQQNAQFLDQPPFNIPSGFQGTFSFTSNVGISVIALRGFSSERVPSDFLITTLPVTNVLAAANTGTVALPHFADGGGWKTQIVLVNPTDGPITGTVQFLSQAGSPVTMTANGQTQTSFAYNIPRQSSFKLLTSGPPGDTAAGSVRITPASGAVTPSSLVIFSYKPGPITLTEAGVPGLQGNAFRMYVEETATGGIGSIQTGFAIANLGATDTTATLELFKLDDGTP